MTKTSLGPDLSSKLSLNDLLEFNKLGEEGKAKVTLQLARAFKTEVRTQRGIEQEQNGPSGGITKG